MDINSNVESIKGSDVLALINEGPEQLRGVDTVMRDYLENQYELNSSAVETELNRKELLSFYELNASPADLSSSSDPSMKELINFFYDNASPVEQSARISKLLESWQSNATPAELNS